MKNYQKWTVVVSCWAIVWVATLHAEEGSEVVKAFNHLNSPEAQFPNGRTVEDARALAILKANPEEAKRLAVATLKKGGRRGRPDITWMMFLFIPEEGRSMMREVMKTYEVGDPSAPFLGSYAYKGEKEDMDRLKREIAFAPDSERVISLTKAMAESDNANSHAILLQLKQTIPGKWQETHELIKFFAGAGAAISQTKANIVEKDGEERKRQTQPSADSEKQRAIGPIAQQKTMGNERSERMWIWWGIGGILAISLLIVLLKKIR